MLKIDRKISARTRIRARVSTLGAINPQLTAQYLHNWVRVLLQNWVILIAHETKD